MFSKESIESLAKFAGLTASELEAKINSESEETFTLPTGKFFTDDELDSRIRNEKTASYTEGKDAGVEMLVKSKKKDLGYDFEGKDFDSLLTFHEQKIKSSFAKPNEKISELESDIQKLNSTHSAEIDTYQSKVVELEKSIERTFINNELLSVVPENTKIPKADLMTLFNANYDVLKEDGKTIIKQNGETLKDDKTASPLSLEDVFMDFATKRDYISKTPGRGGQSEFGENGVNAKSIAAFQNAMEKKGFSLNSAEYDKKYAEWRKANPEVTA